MKSPPPKKFRKICNPTKASLMKQRNYRKQKISKIFTNTRSFLENSLRPFTTMNQLKDFRSLQGNAEVLFTIHPDAVNLIKTPKRNMDTVKAQITPFNLINHLSQSGNASRIFFKNEQAVDLKPKKLPVISSNNSKSITPPPLLEFANNKGIRRLNVDKNQPWYALDNYPSIKKLNLQPQIRKICVLKHNSGSNESLLFHHHERSILKPECQIGLRSILVNSETRSIDSFIFDDNMENEFKYNFKNYPNHLTTQEIPQYFDDVKSTFWPCLKKKFEVESEPIIINDDMLSSANTVDEIMDALHQLSLAQNMPALHPYLNLFSFCSVKPVQNQNFEFDINQTIPYLTEAEQAAVNALDWCF